MAPPTAHPLWSKIRSVTTNVKELTASTIRYAVEYGEVALAHRAAIQQQQQREVFRFEEVGNDAAAPHAHDYLSDDSSVDSADSFTKHLGRGAGHVFNTRSIHPKQGEAVNRIVLDPTSGGKLIVIERTGGGKSLMLYLTAICVGGISLVIIPLLSLTANQMEKIRRAAQTHGAVYAFHLDEESKHDVKQKVIPKMDSFDYNSSTSMLILCSPQYISENIDFRNALLRARDREVLRLIAIDEAHIYAMHGRSFRESVRILGRDFFSKLYRGVKPYYPLCMPMTATMPNSLLSTLSDLTHIDWTKPCHQMRSSPEEFRQRYIDMDLHVQADVGALGISSLLELLENDDQMHACLFVNFKSECSKWAAAIESKLADNLMDVDVIQINGDQDKHAHARQ